MRVLVTGAFGFVGRAVVRRLAAAGHEVRALSSSRTGAGGLPVARVFRADVRDAAALAPAVAGVDAVCHLAALTRGRESVADPQAHREVNLGGTIALLDALRGRAGGGRPLVVFGSTAAVYGAPERQPIDESAEPSPGSPYGESKLAAERELANRAAAGEVLAVVLRCFNAAGAGDVDEARILPRALAVAAGRHPYLELNGDGGVVRDFVHVDDVAEAYLRALGAREVAAAHGGCRVYNVGATPASMRQIVAAVERLTGRPVPVVRRPALPEAPRLVSDCTRIGRELGWRAERSALDRLVLDAWEATGAGA
ncbi:NAD-dependent epimerase/dehydratase family protein [Kitasatospora sp. DSM 101779]|uniref:NAD-dependent epimerase/dehydratase family protein n=1 Tax=Kitasatospora sp. DSM 101779 TaxID=2853165 RepID=UPI0021D91395|nr:NAD-dependent epimerase/dehydratase family protein [Kitasatospora sp. DSM 101779]MCU7825725.1 NAD-dependent epimerase/dehydratase family protein [Kitasatospora sp. DSM 101779]